MNFKIHTTNFNEIHHPRCKRIANSGKYQEHDFEYTIEINTLEELIALKREVDAPLIVTEKIIEIYDDYRE